MVHADYDTESHRAASSTTGEPSPPPTVEMKSEGPIVSHIELAHITPLPPFPEGGLQGWLTVIGAYVTVPVHNFVCSHVSKVPW